MKIMKNYLYFLFVIALCLSNFNTSYADGIDDDIYGYLKSKPHFIDQENVNLVSKMVNIMLQDGDKQTLFSCAKQLSNKGYSIGDYFLGYCYEGGEGCEFNPELAFKYFMKAATAEIPFCWAYRSLGYCYRQGNGTPVDHKEQYKWFKKATETIKAERYLASSYLCLGICFHNGLYVEVDLEKAISCYTKVIESKDEVYSVYAASNLALLYFNDLNDYSKSYYYASIAADLGEQDWQFMVGDAFLSGLFGRYPIEKDRNKAIMYLKKAASQGNVDAAIKLNELGL